MGRHFLSVLGTNNYEPAIYTSEEGEVQTRYIQEAVLKLKMPQLQENDKISVFVTELAYQKNWLDRDYTEQELSRMNLSCDRRRIGLASVLSKEFPQINIENVVNIIPIGANEKELWEIFQIIYEQIGEGEELFIDITHSLRNIPIQMLSVIMYARVVKNVSVSGIYYGAFEAGVTNTEGIKVTEIFDLITFLDVLDWSQAANSFIKYGNSDEIKGLYEIQKKKRKYSMGSLYRVVGCLEDITRGLETSRGCEAVQIYGKKMTNKNSVQHAYRDYKQAFAQMVEQNENADSDVRQKNQIEPLTHLFEVINKKLEIFDTENNQEFGLAAVEWAVENKKTQQGFTALDETIKTFLFNFYGLDELKEEQRDGICKYMCNGLFIEWRKQKSGEHTLSENARENVFQKWKTYRSSNMGAMRKNKENAALSIDEEEQIAHQIAMELPIELAELSNDISSRRNSMNHFGYSNIGNYPSDNLHRELNEYKEKFRKIRAAMLENI